MSNGIDFKPSKYQQAIYDYIEHGQGHLVVEAAAGSGKTTTLIKCLDFIPKDKKVLIVAFNKDIVRELEGRTKVYDNVDVRTLHSLGFLMLRRNYGERGLTPEEFKYESQMKANIRQYSSINPYSLKGRQYIDYFRNIKTYVDFGRCYLAQSLKDLDFIEDRYGIETIADEKEVALEILDWGKTEIDTIDYTDMIWLPHSLNSKPIGLLYDYIMVDECQDLNRAERELILKCFKKGTRMIAVGDANQMVYSFAGADPESFNALKSIPNTVCLPLSISYRCSRSIVDYAKTIVPTIESDENDERQGKIAYNVPFEEIKDGDMVLCRNNAPLVQAYSTFLKMGKKAHIIGKDVGANLKILIKGTRQQKLNADCKADGVFVRLYDDLFTTRNKVMERSAIDEELAMTSSIVQSKLDMIKALEVLAEGVLTTDELISKIDAIFPKRDKKGGILLSTVHKAKGLEANNVYIVCKSLMPSKTAQQDWEIRQEENLMYVAYTRAKNILGFVDEKDFEQFDSSNANSMKALKRIEEQVCKVLGKKRRVAVNTSNMGEILGKAKKITSTRPSLGKTINISEPKKPQSLSESIPNKKKKKHKRSW